MKTYGVGEPMERIAVDILGPLPTSEKGNRFIIVVADYFTQWVEAYPVPNHKAQTVAEALVNNFFMRYVHYTWIKEEISRANYFSKCVSY